jgi:hypothetical protein
VSDEVPAVMLVRLLPGMIGETGRLVHIVPLPAAGPPAGWLTAYCGARFRPGTTELLSGPGGMPCFHCLTEAPAPGTSPRLDASR